ncbi:MAG: hypothetical protein JRE58_11720 [Deltaproteobacteria bacterium]|nr:hypothetical protein [Deltaproteobacteria bacterium]
MPKETELKDEIRELEAQRKDREMALPAHAVHVQQMPAIEKLEDEIEKKRNWKHSNWSDK